MRKISGAVLVVGSIPALFSFWPAWAQQGQQPPQAQPTEVTDLQLQAARANSAEKAAAFNKLAYERLVADATKMQMQTARDVAAKEAWWDRCVWNPACVEWIKSGLKPPAEALERSEMSPEAKAPQSLPPKKR